MARAEQRVRDRDVPKPSRRRDLWEHTSFGMNAVFNNNSAACRGRQSRHYVMCKSKEQVVFMRYWSSLSYG